MAHPEVAILTCVLGDFDELHDPVEQDTPAAFHRWTDENFPPIASWDPRLQYRIPKYFGWEMFPGYETYIWLDGSVTLKRPDCATWYLSQIDGYDIGFFAHPNRSSVKDEVEYIDDYLNHRRGYRTGQKYMIDRYANGLHHDMLKLIQADKNYKDEKLYASTAFIYRNTPKVQSFMQDWWYYQSRYYTCDQVHFPWLLHKWGLKVKTFDEPIFKSGYISLVSRHK